MTSHVASGALMAFTRSTRKMPCDRRRRVCHDRQARGMARLASIQTTLSTLWGPGLCVAAIWTQVDGWDACRLVRRFRLLAATLRARHRPGEHGVSGDQRGYFPALAKSLHPDHVDGAGAAAPDDAGARSDRDRLLRPCNQCWLSLYGNLAGPGGNTRWGDNLTHSTR